MKPERDDRPVNLSDVARAAGVSLTTASHSYSGHRPVSSATRARVFRAAADLGFDRPSATALVGVLLRAPEALGGFLFGTSTFTSFAGAVALACVRRKMTVVTATTLDELLQTVRRPDGCVVMTPNHADTVLRTLIRMDVPTVSFEPDPAARSFAWFLAPDWDASVGALVAEILRGGSRRVAVLVGQTDNAYRQSILRAARRTLSGREHSLLVRVLDNDLGQPAAAECVAGLLRSSQPPDAVITSSSVFALGALEAVHGAGLEVPGQVRIATCIDGPAAELAPIPIAALRIDWTSAAELLVEMLVERLAGAVNPQPEQHTCQPLLLRRSSI